MVLGSALGLVACSAENSAHRRRGRSGAENSASVDATRTGVRAQGSEEVSSRSGPSAAVPDEVGGAAAVTDGRDLLAALMRAIRQGRFDDAEAILEAAGGLDIAAPERSWLWIELGLARARGAEVRRSVDDLPDSDAATVFRALARRDPSEREAGVRRVRSGAWLAWADLVRLTALVEQGGRSDAVRSLAARAVSSGPGFVRQEARIAAARDAIEDDRASEALELLRGAAREDPTDPRAPLLSSAAAARLGERDDAARFALDAWRLAPTSHRIARRVADLVRDGVTPGVEDEIRPVARQIVGSLGAQGREAADERRVAEGLALLGLLEERAHRLEGAIVLYQKALDRGCDPVPVDRHLRRLLFRTGNWKAGLALLFRAVPESVGTEIDDIVAPAWSVLRAVKDHEALARGRADVAEGVVSALVRVGALEEAVAMLEEATDEKSVELRRRLNAEVAFHEAVRVVVEDGYRAPARGEPPVSLAGLHARIVAAAVRHLPAAEVAGISDAETGVRRVPPLGSWMDHSAVPSAPLVAHLRRFGKYLVLGQRSGKPAEALLFSLGSLVPDQVIRTQGRTYRHDVATVYDRTVRGYLDFQGGALAGAALPDGVWLDADAARREEHGVVQAVLSVDPTLRDRLARVARDPPVADSADGIFALDDLAGLWLRLAMRYVRETDGRRWGALDTLRAHEFGHVADLERHLPILRGLPATVGLFVSEGLAVSRVEARLEGRAQLGALMDAERPDLALMDLVARLPVVSRSPTPHERGYSDVVAALLRLIHTESDRFPKIDFSRRLLPQLDRLSLDELRDLGGLLAERGWSARPTPR